VIPRSLRDPAGRQSILDRLGALTPWHPRRWGRMEPGQLLPHLAERDRELVAALIERFATAPPGTLGEVHSTFGRMRPRDWDVLQYRHLDHHLRQFGV
jgi:hypothetical protein